MNNLQIKNFLIVANFGSITKASEELNVAQSTLSKSISSLERELNVKLFTREYHRLTLTMAGLRIYEFFNNADVEFTKLLEDICLKKDPEGVLRIGKLKEMQVSALNKTMREFRAIYSDREIKLFSIPAERVFEELQKNKVDIIVAFELPSELSDQYEKVILQKLPLVLVYNRNFYDQPTIDSFRDELYLYVEYEQSEDESFSILLQEYFWKILCFRPKRQSSVTTFDALRSELAIGEGYYIAVKTEDVIYSKDISCLELGVEINLSAFSTKKYVPYLDKIREIYLRQLTLEGE